jgi:hypothetical protein
MLPEPVCGKRDHVTGRFVEPLRVIDRYDYGRHFTQSRQQGKESRRDRPRLRRRIAGLLLKHRDTQG